MKHDREQHITDRLSREAVRGIVTEKEVPMSERARIRERTLSCTIHKRAFVEGLAQVIEAFVPGVQVHYTNASSRTLDPQADCIEAFHVVFPW